MKTLVLGGMKSGKSRIAARLASESGKRVVFVATARIGDEEMRARILAHRQTRPPHWQVIEEPYEVGSVLQRCADQDTLVLVDCLTMWLTNLLCAGNAERLDAERAELLRHVDAASGDLVLVSNEANMGVVPAGALSRRFCEEMGSLHQALAERSDTVLLALAGLCHVLKSTARPSVR